MYRTCSLYRKEVDKGMDSMADGPLELRRGVVDGGWIEK